MAANTQQKEYNIDVEKKEQGLFVIIREKSHKVIYHDANQDYDWGKRDELNYDPDVTRLLETFNLDEKNSSNLLLGQDLTHTPRELQELEDTVTKLQNEGALTSTAQYRLERCIDEMATHRYGNDTFDSFMQLQVSEYKQKHPPTFVMFFLLSHGFEDGQFLLSSKGRIDGSSQGQCCKYEPHQKHTLTGACHGRHIVSDIIEPVCKIYDRIPKVFIFQTCRGGKDGKLWSNIQGDEPVPGNSSDVELFIPSYPDTFVFRASVEQQASYVLTSLPNRSGSIFIEKFCEALRQMEERSKNYEELINKISVDATTNVDEASNLEESISDQLRRHQEDLVGGWIMNVCHQTSGLVANDKELQKWYTQQPHISSSLSKELSFVKLLKTQKQPKL